MRHQRLASPHTLALLALVFLIACSAACSFEPDDPASQRTPTPEADVGDLDAGDLDATSPPIDVEGRDDTEGADDATLPDPEDAGTPDGTSTPDVDVDDTGPTADVEEDIEADTGPELVVCGEEEVDLSSHGAHCGACDQACDPAFGRCEDGSCACAAGMAVCGPERRCYDIQRDANNCGGCGNSCGPGAFCDGGQCHCRPGLTECNGQCVDTNRHPEHCGGCGNSCGGGSCDGGACKSSDCGWDKFDCEQDGGKACIRGDERTHPLYCNPSVFNQCGDVCTGNQLCARFEFFEGRQCRDYRPARGCDHCPCDDCRNNERCVDDLPGMIGAYCVR